MITQEDDKLLDECMTPKWRDFVSSDKIETEITPEQEQEWHEQNIEEGWY